MTSDRAAAEPDDSLVRAALLAAVAVARSDLRDPERHEAVPGPLRRVAGFRNLPRAALAQVRVALDDDETYRQRVLEAAPSADLDEPSRLFLARPEGWLDLIRELADEATQHESADAEQRAVDRRVRAAEAARDRAEGERQTAALRLDAIAEDLDRERGARSERERQIASLETELAGAKQVIEDLDRQLRVALGKQAEEAHRVEQVAAARDQLRVERDELRSQLAAAQSAHAEPGQDAASPPAGDNATSSSHPAIEGEAAAQIAEAVAGAARAASAMAANLAEVAERIRPGRGVGPQPTGDQDRPDADGQGAPEGDARRWPDRRSRGRPRRQPVPLPPGVFDDSPEAARHVVRVSGIVVLVDGYNASQRRWPQLPIEEQRERLVAALAELSARCGPSVHVVFDGVEAASRTVGGGARGVAVSFTEDGVEADDAIIEAVAHLPDRPVAVVSDDRRVRDGAAAQGANVLSLAQLFAVLRREP